MQDRPMGIRVSRFIALIFLATVLTGHVFAQISSGTLRGKVTDPSGAVIAGANITATTAAGQQTSVVSNGQGGYEIKGLAPGTYTVSAIAEGFATDVEPNVTITADQVQQFDLALGIVVKQEKVEVQADAATVGVNPDDSAAATVIKGKDLEALSDDPDELQSELEALAGPSAGPNGGQIYIDGFTGGQLPPKASIREIRLNQNPFSPEYDKLGYGRIEIFTKPGSDKFHGQLFFDENNGVFNTKNPFAASEPGYHTEIYDGNIGGPINKKASFFVDGELRKINSVSIVDATVPDFNSPTGESELRQSLLSPSWRANVSPRLDYQVSTNNTLTMRYQFEDDRDTNGGIGQFSLAPQAYNSHELEQTIQVSDTQILSANVINETRFRFRRDTSEQTPISSDPTIDVLDAFTTGGSANGRSVDRANQFELQNYTSVTHGKHFWKFGARLRDIHDSSYSTENFNGVFSFASLADYVTARLSFPNAHAQDVGMLCVQNLLAGPPITPEGLADCGARKFSQNTGEPTSEVSVFDAGLYLSDDWRIRPNITFSYGLRFETQNQLHDHGDFAPRLSLAWGVDGGAKRTPKTVLRAGWGMFYDRFQYDLVLQQDRLNGFTQQQIIIQASDVPPAPTIYRTNSDLRAPYTIQSALSLERQLTKSSTLAVTYLNSLGDHQFFTRNINPAEIDPDDGTVTRPLGGDSNIYQYTSEGVFRQNQLILNGRVGLGAKLSLFGFYTLSYANSDTGGASSFPTNQFDPSADYGRASFDVRHRIFLGGSITLPYAVTLNPLIVLNSGNPFNVTVFDDLNGDSIFNDRPGLASTQTCNVKAPNGDNICTPLGTFDPNPAHGASNIVPINYGTGPWTATVNLRLSKTFGFGKKSDRASGGGGPGGGGFPGGGGGGGRSAPGGGLGGRGLSGGGGNPFGGGVSTNRRYNLTLSVSARNLFNRVNLGTPTGVLSSPNFDESTTIAGGPFNSQTSNRRIDLQARFSF